MKRRGWWSGFKTRGLRPVRETDIVRACLAYLHARGCIAWRNNTGAMRIEEPGQPRRFVRFSAPGISDIIGLLPGGRFLAVEVKRGDGRLSAAQQLFLNQVAGAGGFGAVVRSVTELDQAILRADSKRDPAASNTRSGRASTQRGNERKA